MESLHFLDVIGNESGLDKYLQIFASLPGGKSTNPGKFNFLYISPLNFSNLLLIPGAKFNGHRGTWTGCSDFNGLLKVAYYGTLSLTLKV